MLRLLPLAGVVLALLPAAAGAAECPVAPDPAALPSAERLREMTRFEADLGLRATGTPAHNKFVAWLRERYERIPGIKLTEDPFTIDRWTARRATLRFGDKRLPIAGPVPYSKKTPRGGISGPLTFIDDAEPITAANAAGKVVVRPAPRGELQQALLLLPIVSYSTYDPGGTVSPGDTFYGDFLAYNERVADLRAAEAAGAKAILFVKDRPVRQLKGHYEPYEGSDWGVPGLFLGADEGKLLEDALAKGPAKARVELRVERKRVRTPNLMATLPGQSPQKLVIESHTDGTNAAEDNGPVAILAMARYYAKLPLACRPRTLAFAANTAHFYQRLVDPGLRHGGAGVLARQLDKEYDQGKVSAVVVLEHLGAKQYEGVPRPEGKPGVRLRATGRRELQFLAITQSVPLVDAVTEVVHKYDMRRTILLQGADAPGTTVPAHCSFGGEGTPYNQALLPTVASIAAPQSLYDPPFGLEGIDFSVMRSELVGYTELVARMAAMDQESIAGQVTLDRLRRAAGGEHCPNEN